MIGGGFLAVLVLIHLFFRKRAWVRWLAGVPVAICSVSMYTLLVLIMGFLPQTDTETTTWVQQFGFSHLASSWIMVVIQTYMLSSLGLITIRRLIPLHRKNIGFFLNHAGLWLTLVAASIGTSDFYRLQVPLMEGEDYLPFAYNDKGEQYHLPYSLALKNFEIEEYPAQLAVFNKNTSKIAPTPTQESWPHCAEGVKIKYRDIQAEVVKFLPLASREGEEKNYTISTEPNAAQASLVHIRTATTDTTVWLSNGNFVMPYKMYHANDSLAVVMLQAEVKSYRSYIKWRTKDQKTDSAWLEVNKPLTVAGWKIYQISYDEEQGRWSDKSVLEAVADPWLPTVYVGIFMMLAGAVYLFWQGRKSHTQTKNEE
jgi:hypothetical protein